jgi:hypothetical protein
MEGAAMTGSFTFENQVHYRGDHRCSACASEYPQPCRCGGLMHGASAIETAGEPEAVGGIEGDSEVVFTRCDACGRSEDDLAEEVA